MNKQQFLKELGDALASMNEGERNSALQFYADYIEESTSTRIFDELGDPKKIAQRILGEIPHIEEDDFVEPLPSKSDDGKTLRQLRVETEFSTIVIKKGNDYGVTTRGIVYDDLQQRQEGDFWVIRETNKFRSFLNFVSRVKNEGLKIEVTIPSSVEVLEVSTMSGRIEISDLGLKKLTTKTDTGKLIVQRCTIQSLKITSSVGWLQLESLTVTDAIINAQLGSLKVSNSSFSNCDIRGDVAPIEIKTSSILRNMMIRSSVGPIDVQLQQPLSTCQIVVDSSIGNVTINHEKKKVHFVAKAETSLHIRQDIGPVTINLD